MTSTERAPSGVTNAAGANVYAMKFRASPAPTEIMQSKKSIYQCRFKNKNYYRDSSQSVPHMATE